MVRMRELLLVAIALFIGYLVPLQLQSIYSLVFVLISLILFSFPFSVYLLVEGKQKIKNAIILATKDLHKIVIAVILYYIIVIAGIVMLIVPGAYLFLKLSFTPQFILLEKKKVYESMKLSFDYSKKQFLSLVKYGFILLFAYYILMLFGFSFTWLSFIAIYQILVTKIFLYGSKFVRNSKRKRNRAKRSFW